MLVENHKFEPTPPIFGAPVGVTPLKFRRDFFCGRILESLAIVWCCLRYPTFSYFGTVPACDRRTVRQPHDDSIYRASIASRGKTGKYHFGRTPAGKGVIVESDQK